ncbi:LamB/YcsF family protein [Parenemella sanctibonifatiensis]|uniref:LamB/YcsF family protein n=1 Tax=Parenemella sanctibonifatiensis TaxID=2016505 RepID=A0A255EBS6_9ACTN|nr:5-oxoprolinase subunit PxpA [Parenemella sanctibonifatiensis]OYN89014.1 hypothetical protein CGZ91_12125 [Parenemella sanctibonifatiensis]
MASVDLNADLGEECGSDAELLRVVTSANVACGQHAGSDQVMATTVAAARSAGVTIGAHPSYSDREGFGRTPQEPASAELTALVADQIRTLQRHAEALETRVAYVKPHGGLYNVIAHDQRQAEAVVAAVVEVSADLALLCQPGTVAARVAEAAGLRVVGEVFADRAYTSEGTLVPRSVPGAVIDDPEIVVTRVRRWLETGRIATIDGGAVPVAARSVCVHGDTPGALALAQSVADGLRRAGVELRAFA